MIRAGNGLPERAPKRIWLTYDFYYSGEKLPPDFVVTRTRTIRGANGTQSLLELAERK